MPIVPDYPCHCGFSWEDARDCPSCGATCGVMFCSSCDGLLDSCYMCDVQTPGYWSSPDPTPSTLLDLEDEPYHGYADEH